jgi:hypothetical protein
LISGAFLPDTLIFSTSFGKIYSFPKPEILDLGTIEQINVLPIATHKKHLQEEYAQGVVSDLIELFKVKTDCQQTGKPWNLAVHRYVVGRHG